MLTEYEMMMLLGGKHPAFERYCIADTLDRVVGTTRSPLEAHIDRVIFHEPATIVYWTDGTRTVVKTQNGEPFDPEKGLVMAIVKRVCGNTGGYYSVVRKWTNTYTPKDGNANE